MKSLIVSVLGVTMLLTGCASLSNTSPNSNANHIVVNAYVPPNKTVTWVMVWNNSSPPKYYVVGADKVSTVGKQVAFINSASSQGSSGVKSNKLPVGTKLFATPGYTATESIAVQLPDGSYVKALYAGSQQP